MKIPKTPGAMSDPDRCEDCTPAFAGRPPLFPEMKQDLRRLHYDSPGLYRLTVRAIGELLDAAHGGDSALAAWVAAHDTSQIEDPPDFEPIDRPGASSIQLKAEAALADSRMLAHLSEDEVVQLADYVVDAGTAEVGGLTTLACRSHSAADLASAQLMMRRLAERPTGLLAAFGAAQGTTAKEVER